MNGATLIRYIDLVLLAAALPLFVLAGLPMLGYVAGGGVWLLQRGIQHVLNRRVAASRDPRTVVGITAGSMIGRGWLLGLILLGSGLAAGEDVGLSAAVLVFVIFTVHFTLKIILRSAEPQPPVTT